MSKNETDTTLETLAQILPSGPEPGKLVGNEAVSLFQENWHKLRELGFEIDTGPDTLTVRHRDRGFESVIHLSRDSDLGELRALFLALRSHFGRLRDRWMPWLFLPGQAVTAPYEHLRQITSVCQQLRQARPTPS